jgi:shikimate dehydrogenase
LNSSDKGKDRTQLKFGLIGYPVSHSMSPAIFKAAFAAAGISGSYDLYSVPPEDLGREVEKLVKDGVRGFNVTVPHKTAVIPMMADMDESARVTGAVNAVLAGSEGLAGYNTDMGGFGDSFDYLGVPDVSGETVLVLGAGGAARAVVASLVQQDVSRIVIANRFFEETMDLLTALAPSIKGVDIEAVAPDDQDLERLCAGAVLCVQATSLGLKPDDPLPLAADRLPGGCFVYDLVYGREETAFVKSALGHGHRAADGREMLLRQAARNYSIWLGADPPLEAMRAGMEEAMKGTGR